MRVAEAEMRLEQDIGFRAEWIERRARVAEEAAWSLAAAARAGALGASLAPSAESPRASLRIGARPSLDRDPGGRVGRADLAPRGPDAEARAAMLAAHRARWRR